MSGVPDELCSLISDHFCDIRRGLINFQNNRAEDKLTYALFQAGFLAPVSDNAREFYPLQRVLLPAESDPAGSTLNEESKQALLEAAICFAGDVEDIPVTRSWFQVSGPALCFMQNMALFGYAEHHDGQFRWTDQIGPSMRAAYFWNDDGGSVDDGASL